MASFNKIVLMGNVTRNPDIRTIPGSSNAVARTGIAVNRKYRDKEEVMFVDIVAFGRTAEIMGEYVVKGTPILIDGRLSMNSWEQDGQRRTKHEVIIESMQMLGRRDDSRSDYEPAGNSNNFSSDTIDEDDVPF